MRLTCFNLPSALKMSVNHPYSVAPRLHRDEK